MCPFLVNREQNLPKELGNREREELGSNPSYTRWNPKSAVAQICHLTSPTSAGRVNEKTAGGSSRYLYRREARQSQGPAAGKCPLVGGARLRELPGSPNDKVSAVPFRMNVAQRFVVTCKLVAGEKLEVPQNKIG